MNNHSFVTIINPLNKRQGGYYSVLLYFRRECFSLPKQTCNGRSNSDFFNLKEEYEVKQTFNKWTDL